MLSLALCVSLALFPFLPLVSVYDVIIRHRSRLSLLSLCSLSALSALSYQNSIFGGIERIARHSNAIRENICAAQIRLNKDRHSEQQRGSETKRQKQGG